MNWGNSCLAPTAATRWLFSLTHMWVMNRKRASVQIKFHETHMQTVHPSVTQARRDDKPSVRDTSRAGTYVALAAVGEGTVPHKLYSRSPSFPVWGSSSACWPMSDSMVSLFSAPVTSPLNKGGNHSHVSKNHSVFSLRFYRIPPLPPQQQPCQNDVKNRPGNTFHICRQS